MKIWITLFTLSLSSLSFADAGISIGYRSVPTTIWKNQSVTPKHGYDTINGVYRRSLNVITLNLFFDDSLIHKKTNRSDFYSGPQIQKIVKANRPQTKTHANSSQAQEMLSQSLVFCFS